MVAALNSWWPDTILFRSVNGGSTWTRIWDWTSYPNRSFRYLQNITAAPWLTFGANPQLPEITPKLGWMVGDLEIDPFNSNRMMYGTGATIYGSDDLTTWDTGGQINISVKAIGLEETAVLDLISPPSGAPLLSGLGDICGFRHNSLTAVPATMMTTPTFVSTTSLDYAELTPNFIVRVGNANAGVNRSGFSFDGGTSWFQGNTEPGGVTWRRNRRGGGQREPRGVESFRRRRKLLDQQWQFLDAIRGDSFRRQSRVGSCEPDEVLRVRQRNVLCEHKRRRQFHRGGDGASVRRQVQSRAGNRRRYLARWRRRRTLAFDQLRRQLHQGNQCRGGQYDRLRHGRARTELHGALLQRPGQWRARHISFRQRRRELGADQ